MTSKIPSPGIPWLFPKRQRWLPRAAVFTFCVVIAALRVRADQVEMRNGDHYVGTVLSLDTNTLILRSDVLGTVHVPRGRVALITLGSSARTNFLVSAPVGQGSAAPFVLSNGVTDLSASLRQLGAIHQVQAQFLGAAGPEANAKFNELVGGLMSGKLTVDDIRKEAKSAADQLKELKRDLGEDGGWALDGYLAILDNFLRETSSPVSVAATNASGALPKAEPSRREK